MPVINNSNNNNSLAEKQRQDVQAQLKLNKKTKSTDDVNLEKVKKLSLEDTKKVNKSQESISPRKGIKKSVSMSAICVENDKCMFSPLFYIFELKNWCSSRIEVHLSRGDSGSDIPVDKIPSWMLILAEKIGISATRDNLMKFLTTSLRL